MARARVRHVVGGQALVEFSLTIGIVLLLFLAVVDFGRMAVLHTAAVTASREAARYGSSIGDVAVGVKRYQQCDGIRQAARTVTSGLITLSATDIAVSFDSGPGTPVAATCPTTSGATIAASAVQSLDRVVVQVTYTYRPITPLGLIVGPVTVISTDRRTIVLAP